MHTPTCTINTGTLEWDYYIWLWDVQIGISLHSTAFYDFNCSFRRFLDAAKRDARNVTLNTFLVLLLRALL